MQLTEKQIEEIAEWLDCGFRCYFNHKTGVIKTILNSDTWMDADLGAWAEDAKEIDAQREDYIEFEGFESYDSFQVMADFTEHVDDKSLQQRLIGALNRRKPFQNFKWEIDNSGEYRQQWFDYKKMRYIQWVKDQIPFDGENHHR